MKWFLGSFRSTRSNCDVKDITMVCSRKSETYITSSVKFSQVFSGIPFQVFSSLTAFIIYSLQVNKRLKDLVKSAVNPETDEIGALSNSVEEFTSAFVNPLRSDNDTRNTFKSCLDYVVDKAIDAEQKKVLDIVVSTPSYLVRVDIEVVSSCINFLDLFMDVYLDQFAAKKIILQ